MAKVKITGHASGTGVITVTAPNTSTDRTITLPDGTGTLIADDGSGNVGIGTSSPSYPLHLATTGSTSAQMGISNTGTGEAGLYFDASNGDFLGSDYAWIAQNNDLSLEITTGALSNAPIILKTNDSERLRIDSDGLKFNGDTAAANALDDYEEGTWTPAYTGDSGVPTVAYSIQVGSYVKIGKFVFLSFSINTSSVSGGSSSSDLLVSGLPFTCGSQSGDSGALSTVRTQNWVSNARSPVGGYINANTNYIYLNSYDAGAYATSTLCDTDDLRTTGDSNQLTATVTYIT